MSITSGDIITFKNKTHLWYEPKDYNLNTDEDWTEGISIFHFKKNEYTEVYKKWIKYPVPINTDEGVSLGTMYSTGSLQLIYEPNTQTWPAGKLMGLASYANEDIVNEAITSNENKQSVKVITDGLEYSSAIKVRIEEEFADVLRLLQFNTRGHDLFRRWYVDGRIFFQKVIDAENTKNGIVELKYLDPRKVKKIREVRKRRPEGMVSPTNINIADETVEYFVYNERGIQGAAAVQGIKVAVDTIAFCPSGMIDQNKNGLILSYLHKAIKPVNQLKMIEDSLVIYRISRAPERRIFYIDVGNLPKVKAEQYVQDIMNKFRNKIVYDATTGETRDDRKHLSMMEDFWMPRREGGKGTEITTLPGGQNLGDIQDIQYFQQKLYQALNVPLSRLQQQQGFSLGRSTEITRDEIKFSKFIIILLFPISFVIIKKNPRSKGL